MIIHLSPSIYACPKTEPCSLIDLTCNELNIDLVGGKELTARRPYPNKKYLVACRKVGQKAMNGILIESKTPVREFTVVTRWSVAASHIATHRVHYIILDEEYDAISENMVLWYATSESLGSYKSRWPGNEEYGTPATSQPRMEAYQRLRRVGPIRDVTDESGAVIERSEVFKLPTLQPERVLNSKLSYGDRTPSLEAAFR